MRRARYEVLGQEGETLTIRDVGHNQGCLSVTNDAEAVVYELFTEGVLQPGQRLLYFDSQGDLDEMLHLDGLFLGFAPGPGRTA